MNSANAPQRVEHDSMGPIAVPADRLYGPQTVRSLKYFAIGDERMPQAIIKAIAAVKIACAQVNHEMGKLDADRARLIIQAAEEIVAGRHEQEFPLRVWQTGSGTQTHVNVNEVIANRANELAGAARGSKSPVHPNDHVNASQSSNDVFPTAMHLAVAEALVTQLLPRVEGLRDSLVAKQREFADVVKLGRTHLMDAVPLTLGQEFSGYVAQVDQAIAAVRATLPGVYELAIGGTAVGTGLNAPPDFGTRVAARLAAMTGLPFVPAPNRFAALAAHDALVRVSGVLRSLAAALFKIANDVRWMGSGPLAGLGELRLPANEPGSSIMPGKVNPTQCEALAMVCVQVMANDVAIGFAGSQGNFELNVCKPLIIHAALQSIRLLGDACASFANHCVAGLEADRDRLSANVAGSPTLATLLNERVGYEAAARAVRLALQTRKPLRDVCVELGLLAAEEFDQLVTMDRAVGPRA